MSRPPAESLSVPAHLPGLVLAYGRGRDVDAAFDDALDVAAFEHGSAGLHASLAAVDPGEVMVRDADGQSLPLARRAALGVVEELAAGQTFAFAVRPARAYSRRTLRLTLTETTQVLAELVGPLEVAPAVLERVRQGAAEAGGEVGADELVESVTVATARHRFKAVLESFSGKACASYALLAPSTQRLHPQRFPTAGAAKRAAREMVRDGEVDDSPTGCLEVVRISVREGGPFARVTRSRVASRVALKVVLCRLKERPAAADGWLFLARPAQG